MTRPNLKNRRQPTRRPADSVRLMAQGDFATDGVVGRQSQARYRVVVPTQGAPR